jgi:tetratricopeptide (TPR) repeat protein
MMYLAVREDDIARAESLVVRVGKDYADSAMFAAAHGDSAMTARLVAEARGAVSVGAAANAVWQVGDWLDRPDAAEPFARAAAARPERAGRTNMLLAQNLIAQGRWTAADSALAAAARTSPDPWPRLARGLVASLPFLAVPRAELVAIRADVVAADTGRPTATASSPRTELLPQVRIYALGLLDSRLGQPDAALRSAAQLEAGQVAADNLPVVRALAAAVRADVALAAHRPADAVSALDAVRGSVPLDLSGAGPFGEDYARFLRSEALLALGNDGEAVRWLENGFDGTPDNMAFRAQVALRLGDIYERAGQRQKAIDSYARFARLWRRCDTRLQPAVQDARARLARLTGEPRT